MPKMTRYITTAASLLMATTALAQTTPPDRSMPAGKSADAITCADIVTMDSAVVPGVLYFVAGYNEGSKAGMGGSDGAEMSGTADTSGTDTAGTDTTADTGGTDTAADTSGTDSTDTAGTDTDMSQSATASDDAASGDGMQIVRVAGHFEIPVEQIMTVCQGAPDQKVGDVVRQNAGDDQATSD